jgi:hypothetical protein
MRFRPANCFLKDRILHIRRYPEIIARRPGEFLPRAHSNSMGRVKNPQFMGCFQGFLQFSRRGIPVAKQGSDD